MQKQTLDVLNMSTYPPLGKKSLDICEELKVAACKYYNDGNLTAASYWLTVALEYCPAYYVDNDESLG